MKRIFCRLVILIVGMAGLTFVAAGEQSGSGVAKHDKWVTRIESTIRELVGQEPTDDTAHDVALAAHGLALAGRVNLALQLVNEHIENERLRHSAIQQIADGQSTVDDLKGALETASLLPEGYMRERTLKVIVARQAQRGDFRDANDCLAHIFSRGA